MCAPAAALAGATSQHPALAVLDLSGCDIGAEADDAFGVCLASNQCLRELALGSNALGDGVVAGLAQGLAQHPQLTRLVLRSNRIGPGKAARLAGPPRRWRLLTPNARAPVRNAVALKTALRPSAARARRG